MEGVYLLVALSLAMFSGSYLAGLIPLAFSMSEGRIRIISIFGAGLLVGTALSVIIPEGVEVLYNAKAERASVDVHHGDAGSILEKNAGQVENLPRIIPQNVELNEKLVEGRLEKGVVIVGKTSNARRLHEFGGAFIKPAPADEQQNDNSVADDHHNEEESTNAWAHKSIGFSLVIGFLVMLVIDQASRAASGSERSRFGLTATIGLVVHAAADGVALGSASATNRTDVQFIAPAAFGLISFLLVEGLERFRAKRHLLVFSLSAPATAMLTFYTIIAFGGNSSFSTHSFTGVLMLFSAGTFLYVATVHVIPELTKATNEFHLVGTSNASVGHCHSGGPSFSKRELLAMLVGALFPAVVASGHSHSH